VTPAPPPENDSLSRAQGACACSLPPATNFHPLFNGEIMGKAVDQFHQVSFSDREPAERLLQASDCAAAATI
jgi:hypothetical protein